MYARISLGVHRAKCTWSDESGGFSGHPQRSRYIAGREQCCPAFEPVSVVLYRTLPATGSAVTDAIPFPPSSTRAKSYPRRKGNDGSVGQGPARYSNLMH